MFTLSLKKAISVIIIAAFCFQDLVYANPDLYINKNAQSSSTLAPASTIEQKANDAQLATAIKFIAKKIYEDKVLPENVSVFTKDLPELYPSVFTPEVVQRIVPGTIRLEGSLLKLAVKTDKGRLDLLCPLIGGEVKPDSPMSKQSMLQQKGNDAQLAAAIKLLAKMIREDKVSPEELPSYIKDQDLPASDPLIFTPEILARIIPDSVRLEADELRLAIRTAEGVRDVRCSLAADNTVLDIGMPKTAEGTKSDDSLTAAEGQQGAIHEGTKTLGAQGNGTRWSRVKAAIIRWWRRHQNRWTLVGQPGVNDIIRGYWKDGLPQEGCRLISGNDMASVSIELNRTAIGKEALKKLSDESYRVYIYDIGRREFVKGISTHSGIRTVSIHITKDEYVRLKSLGWAHLAARLIHETSEISDWRKFAKDRLAIDIGRVTLNYEQWANGIRKWIRDHWNKENRLARDLDKTFHRKGLELEIYVLSEGILQREEADVNSELYKNITKAAEAFLEKGPLNKYVTDPEADFLLSQPVSKEIVECLRHFSNPQDRASFVEIVYVSALFLYEKNKSGGIDKALESAADSTQKLEEINRRLDPVIAGMRRVSSIDEWLHAQVSSWLKYVKQSQGSYLSLGDRTKLGDKIAELEKIINEKVAQGTRDGEDDDSSDNIIASALPRPTAQRPGEDYVPEFGKIPYRNEVVEQMDPQKEPAKLWERQWIVEKARRIVWSALPMTSSRDRADSSSLSNRPSTAGTKRTAGTGGAEYIHIERFSKADDFDVRVDHVRAGIQNYIKADPHGVLAKSKGLYKMFCGSDYFDVNDKKPYPQTIHMTIVLNGTEALRNSKDRPIDQKRLEEEAKQDQPPIYNIIGDEARALFPNVPNITRIEVAVVGLGSIKAALGDYKAIFKDACRNRAISELVRSFNSEYSGLMKKASPVSNDAVAIDAGIMANIRGELVRITATANLPAVTKAKAQTLLQMLALYEISNRGWAEAEKALDACLKLPNISKETKEALNKVHKYLFALGQFDLGLPSAKKTLGGFLAAPALSQDVRQGMQELMDYVDILESGSSMSQEAKADLQRLLVRIYREEMQVAGDMLNKRGEFTEQALGHLEVAYINELIASQGKAIEERAQAIKDLETKATAVASAQRDDDLTAARENVGKAVSERKELEESLKRLREDKKWVAFESLKKPLDELFAVVDPNGAELGGIKDVSGKIEKTRLLCEAMQEQARRDKIDKLRRDKAEHQAKLDEIHKLEADTKVLGAKFDQRRAATVRQVFDNIQKTLASFQKEQGVEDLAGFIAAQDGLHEDLKSLSAQLEQLELLEQRKKGIEQSSRRIEEIEGMVDDLSPVTVDDMIAGFVEEQAASETAYDTLGLIERSRKLDEEQARIREELPARIQELKTKTELFREYKGLIAQRLEIGHSLTAHKDIDSEIGNLHLKIEEKENLIARSGNIKQAIDLIVDLAKAPGAHAGDLRTFKDKFAFIQERCKALADELADIEKAERELEGLKKRSADKDKQAVSSKIIEVNTTIENIESLAERLRIIKEKADRIITLSGQIQGIPQDSEIAALVALEASDKMVEIEKRYTAIDGSLKDHGADIKNTEEKIKALLAREKTLERGLQALSGVVEKEKGQQGTEKIRLEAQITAAERKLEILSKRIEDTLRKKELNPTDIKEGMVVGGIYRIEKMISKGGFGAVFKASYIPAYVDQQRTPFDRDVLRKRALAIKFLMPNLTSVDAAHQAETKENAESRFRREIETTQKLSQLQNPPPIALYRGDGNHAGTAYLVLDYVEGVAFNEIISQVKQGEIHLDLEQRVTLLSAIAKALRRFHGANAMHRDLKPQQIIIPVDENGKLVIPKYGTPNFDQFAAAIRIVDLGNSIIGKGEMGGDSFKVVDYRELARGATTTNVTHYSEQIPFSPCHMSSELAILVAVLNTGKYKELLPQAATGPTQTPETAQTPADQIIEVKAIPNFLREDARAPAVRMPRGSLKVASPTDIHAFGVMVYELLAGDYPLPLTTASREELFTQIIRGKRKSLRKVQTETNRTKPPRPYVGRIFLDRINKELVDILRSTTQAEVAPPVEGIFRDPEDRKVIVAKWANTVLRGGEDFLKERLNAIFQGDNLGKLVPPGADPEEQKQWIDRISKAVINMVFPKMPLLGQDDGRLEALAIMMVDMDPNKRPLIGDIDEDIDKWLKGDKAGMKYPPLVAGQEPEERPATAGTSRRSFLKTGAIVAGVAAAAVGGAYTLLKYSEKIKENVGIGSTPAEEAIRTMKKLDTLCIKDEKPGEIIDTIKFMVKMVKKDLDKMDPKVAAELLDSIVKGELAIMHITSVDGDNYEAKRYGQSLIEKPEYKESIRRLGMISRAVIELLIDDGYKSNDAGDRSRSFEMAEGLIKGLKDDDLKSLYSGYIQLSRKDFDNASKSFGAYMANWARLAQETGISEEEKVSREDKAAYGLSLSASVLLEQLRAQKAANDNAGVQNTTTAIAQNIEKLLATRLAFWGHFYKGETFAVIGNEVKAKESYAEAEKSLGAKPDRLLKIVVSQRLGKAQDLGDIGTMPWTGTFLYTIPVIFRADIKNVLKKAAEGAGQKTGTEKGALPAKKQSPVANNVKDAPDHRLLNALIECAASEGLIAEAPYESESGVKIYQIGDGKCENFMDIYIRIQDKHEVWKQFMKRFDGMRISRREARRLFSDGLTKLGNVSGHAGIENSRIFIVGDYVEGHAADKTLIGHEMYEMRLHQAKAAQIVNLDSWENVPKDKRRDAINRLRAWQGYNNFALSAHEEASKLFPVSGIEIVPDSQMEIAEDIFQAPVAAVTNSAAASQETPDRKVLIDTIIATIATIASANMDIFPESVEEMPAGKLGSAKKGVILFVDDMIDNDAVFDLDKLARIIGAEGSVIGKVVLFSENAAKADLVQAIIHKSNPKAEVNVVLDSDIKAVNKDYYSIRTLNAVIAHTLNRNSGIFANSTDIIGVVRGPLKANEDPEKLREELTESNRRVPVVVFAPYEKKNVYSVMEAVSELIGMRLEDGRASRGFLFILPAITKLSDAIKEQYANYKRMLDVLTNL